jgi:hypothetical protein
MRTGYIMLTKHLKVRQATTSENWEVHRLIILRWILDKLEYEDMNPIHLSRDRVEWWASGYINGGEQLHYVIDTSVCQESYTME